MIQWDLECLDFVFIFRLCCDYGVAKSEIDEHSNERPVSKHRFSRLITEKYWKLVESAKNQILTENSTNVNRTSQTWNESYDTILPNKNKESHQWRNSNVTLICYCLSGDDNLWPFRTDWVRTVALAIEQSQQSECILCLCQTSNLNCSSRQTVWFGANFIRHKYRNNRTDRPNRPNDQSNHNKMSELKLFHSFLSEKISKVRFVLESYTASNCFVTGSWGASENAITLWKLMRDEFSDGENDNEYVPKSIGKIPVHGDVTGLEFLDFNSHIACSTSSNESEYQPPH